ncbi:MAG TPA: nucleotidyltransferase family protein [Nitrosopumilaceae archaeon]|nr:nucleotidyltransferase family protein [Nitrosopumilaceae archaeon]
MKAVILAGGSGTRGKPFTDYFPKAMIPIEGKPLIDYIVRYLSSIDFIKEIIILADYNGLGSQIKSYFENRKDLKKIKFVQDSNSGTGGDLVHLLSHIKDGEFTLWFVDNLCAINLKMMYKFHKKTKSIACIATRRYRSEETGHAIVKEGRILEFNEKPTIQLEMPECLGIYILKTNILKMIRAKKTRKKNINLSYDVLQELSKKHTVSAFDIEKTPWVDIESPIKVERNDKLIKNIIRKMKN